MNSFLENFFLLQELFDLLFTNLFLDDKIIVQSLSHYFENFGHQFFDGLNILGPALEFAFVQSFSCLNTNLINKLLELIRFGKLFSKITVVDILFLFQPYFCSSLSFLKKTLNLLEERIGLYIFYHP
jgi:hypothetical protein